MKTSLLVLQWQYETETESKATLETELVRKFAVNSIFLLFYLFYQLKNDLQRLFFKNVISIDGQKRETNKNREKNINSELFTSQTHSLWPLVAINLTYFAVGLN